MISHFSLTATNGTLTAVAVEAKDLTLPEITLETDTDNRVGYAGVVPIALKYGEMSCEFTTTKRTALFTQIMASPKVTLTFRGAELESATNTYNTHVVTLTGRCTVLPVGELNADGTGEYGFEMTVFSIQETINGQNSLTFDPVNYLYIIGDGVNLLENVAVSLGI